MLGALTPPAIRYHRTAQYFDTAAGLVFDPFVAVRAAATLVTEPLLDPARLNRLAWQHAADPAVPGVAELLAALLAATWRRADPLPADVPAGAAVQLTADWALLPHALRTLDSDALHAPVRSELRAVLRGLAPDLRQQGGDHHEEAAELITAYLAAPDSVRLDPLPRVPPGAAN